MVKHSIMIYTTIQLFELIRSVCIVMTLFSFEIFEASISAYIKVD